MIPLWISSKNTFQLANNLYKISWSMFTGGNIKNKKYNSNSIGIVNEILIGKQSPNIGYLHITPSKMQ
jgi:hypothetical protein